MHQYSPHTSVPALQHTIPVDSDVNLEFCSQYLQDIYMTQYKKNGRMVFIVVFDSNL